MKKWIEVTLDQLAEHPSETLVRRLSYLTDTRFLFDKIDNGEVAGVYGGISFDADGCRWFIHRNDYYMKPMEEV